MLYYSSFRLEYFSTEQNNDAFFVYGSVSLSSVYIVDYWNY